MLSQYNTKMDNCAIERRAELYVAIVSGSLLIVSEILAQSGCEQNSVIDLLVSILDLYKKRDSTETSDTDPAI